MNDLAWRFVPGTKGRYIVSNYGDLQKINDNESVNYMCGTRNWSGYRMHDIRINGVNGKQQIGFYQLLSFVGPKPSPEYQVCHRDDVSDNNYLPNLYWGTREDQLRDRIANGGIAVGERNGSAKLTEDMVHTIRQLRNQLGWKVQAIADQFGIAKSNVSEIANYKKWSHI